MKTPALIVSAAVAVAVSACADQQTDLLAPNAADEARSARADCRPAQLSITTTGDVATDDCVFDNGGTPQYEDIYFVNQRRLGMNDLSGASMLTFTGGADFDAIFGIGARTGREIFPTPVYGYSSFGAGDTGTFYNSISFIGSAPMYSMWFGGQGPAQLGSYTLTTSIGPSIDTCENGHWVFLQGDIAFTSDISDATSCQGTVSVGPNVGQPLNYQFWYYKLLPGETIRLSLTGLDPDPTLVLAAIDFGTGQAELDFSDAPGDADRSVTFTATRQLYLYVEVSSAPGVSSGYTLTVDGP